MRLREKIIYYSPWIPALGVPLTFLFLLRGHNTALENREHYLWSAVFQGVFVYPILIISIHMVKELC